jgi:4-amino-4-deoxy-L-arabinose transferase-like glycosyltransferase
VVRGARIAIAAVVVVTLVRVASTHRTFSATIDEPAHVAAGFEWLEGTYELDIEHPPLSRALAALPLWLEGAKAPATPDWIARGNALLLNGARYVHNVALVRKGNLLFLALALIGVAAWAWHLFGAAEAIAATVIYASLPPILAHAGLATTDMAAAATIPLSLYALTRWLDSPTLRRAVLLGLACGIGALSKFSFVLLFPLGAAIAIAFRFRRVPFRWRDIAAAVAIALLIVAIGYRFDLRTFIDGILAVKAHDERGHHAFLFGELRTEGWWYYFPVALFFKSPLPLFALAIAGLGWRLRMTLEVVLIAAAMLAATMPSSINIGVRHLLPLYAPLAIAAAAGGVTLWRKGIVPRAIGGAFALWLVIGSALAHPDYLPWFNEAAGSHPERILADSNLDWGQDILRLRRVCRDEKITRLTAQLFTSAPLPQLGLPPLDAADTATVARGWIAISETSYQALGGDGRAYRWLHGRPYRRIGKSIRLYHAP